MCTKWRQWLSPLQLLSCLPVCACTPVCVRDKKWLRPITPAILFSHYTASWPTYILVLLVALSSHNNFATGPLEQFHQTHPMSGWHNAGQVGTGFRLLAIKILQGFTQRRHQDIFCGRWTQHIVRSHATLASVEKFSPHQAVSSCCDVHPPVNEAWTLPTQLQGYWGQVDWSCLQDAARHRLRT